MRRGGGAEFQGKCLGLAVEEIREIESALAGPELHVVKVVPEVRVAELVQTDGGGTIGGHGDHRDATRLIVACESLDAFLIGLGGGAVVAGEDDRQHAGPGIFGFRVPIAVDSRQVKGGQWRANRQGGMSHAVGSNKRERHEEGQAADQGVHEVTLPARFRRPQCDFRGRQPRHCIDALFGLRAAPAEFFPSPRTTFRTSATTEAPVPCGPVHFPRPSNRS